MLSRKATQYKMAAVSVNGADAAAHRDARVQDKSLSDGRVIGDPATYAEGGHTGEERTVL